MREVCPRCFRPVVACYCAQIEPIPTRTRVVLLQHPRERDVAIGTARMASLCLPSSELHVGVDFANDRDVRAALSDEARPPILLFPGPHAKDIRAEPPEGPVTLVVIDGTWWQAAKLLKRNPALAALPRYGLAPSRPSNYRIRREPAEHCVATIEALAEVLGVLEGDAARMARLLAPFDAMVETQLAYAAREGGARVRHKRKGGPRATRRGPSILRDRFDDIVLAYGEANAWPYGMPGAPRPQIVHWTAVRPSTGERFESIIERETLNASFAMHAKLTSERLGDGEPFGSFCERWSAFVRPTDVLCSWGTYAPDVLASEGVPLPARYDLRPATIQHVGVRAGSIAGFARALDVEPEPPWTCGRAGQRIAEITAVVAAFTSDLAPASRAIASAAEARPSSPTPPSS